MRQLQDEASDLITPLELILPTIMKKNYPVKYERLKICSFSQKLFKESTDD